MKKFLKNKGLGFYFNAVAAVIGLAAAIIYMIYSLGVESFNFVIFTTLLLGVAATVILVFIDLPFLTIVSVALQSIALATYIGSMLALFGFYFTDTWAVAGSLETMEMVIFIMILIAIGMLINIASAFMKTRKRIMPLQKQAAE